MLDGGRNGRSAAADSPAPKHRISAAGRRAIAAAQGRRWAEQYVELPAGVTVCILLALGLLYGVRSPRRLLQLGLMATVGFVVAIGMDGWLSKCGVRVRNFYGVLRVSDHRGVRILSNGAIHHGPQFLTPDTNLRRGAVRSPCESWWP